MGFDQWSLVIEVSLSQRKAGLFFLLPRLQLSDSNEVYPAERIRVLGTDHIQTTRNDFGGKSKR